MIFLVCLSFFECPAQDWKLKKENDQIKVYTAETPNSPFKSVRVECTVKGNFSRVIAVLYDVDHHKDWVFNTKYSKLLKKVADNELIYYSEVSAPWPSSNRDFIAHLRIVQPAPNKVVIASHAEPGFVPEKSGIVRIKSSAAAWTMTSSGDNVKIDYIVQFDPAGSVPAWLINMFITKGPFETFQKLQGRMDMPAYQNAHYDFIKD
jgi:hypothetical protein